MQQLPAWARRKVILCAAVALILGMILVIWSWAGDGLASTTEGTFAIQGSAEPELSATAVDEEQAPGQAQNPEATATAAFVVVHVSGAVRNPDVYRLPSEARVKDAVLAAGGFTPDADAEQINLAEHIVDAQHIHIPRQGEVPPAAPPAQDGQPATDAGALLNVNTASATELEALDGVGKVLAERIIEYRTANGPFQSVEDLQKVKGITTRVFALIAPHLTIGP